MLLGHTSVQLTHYIRTEALIFLNYSTRALSSELCKAARPFFIIYSRESVYYSYLIIVEKLRVEHAIMELQNLVIIQVIVR